MTRIHLKLSYSHKNLGISTFYGIRVDISQMQV